MEIFGFLVGLGLAGYFYFKWYNLKKEKQEIITLNEKKRLENQELEENQKNSKKGIAPTTCEWLVHKG